MPQATDDLRQEWGGRMGIAEDKAEAALIAYGFSIDRGLIQPPSGWDWDGRDELWRAVCFLTDEWDYEYATSPTQQDRRDA